MSFSPANSEEFKSLLEKAVSVERDFVRQNFIEHLSICEDLNEMADNMLIALKVSIFVHVNSHFLNLRIVLIGDFIFILSYHFCKSCYSIFVRPSLR